MDNLSPEWVKCFDVPYKFEEKQVFKVTVYDIDDFDHLTKWDRHDLVGAVEFTLHEVVTAKDQLLVRPISKTKKDAVVEIAGEEFQPNEVDNDQVVVNPSLCFPVGSGKFSGQVLFFLIYRMHKESSLPGGPHIWKPIYKSEIKSQSNNRQSLLFEFSQVILLKHDLCSSDEDRDIKIEFFVSQKNGRHKNIGNVLFSISDLRQHPDNFEIPIAKQPNSTFQLKQTKIAKRNTFLEYIFGGCEINLAIAVDFTLSNGKPDDRDSLHNKNLGANQYHQALKSVGDILQFYDSDKQFPLFGFGGRLRVGLDYTGAASHCFALNGNIFDPECDGLDGVLEAYKHAIHNVDFYGPTYFNKVIETVNDMAEGLEVSQQNQKYLILLIITDGILNDMEKTIDQIVRGSSLPLSIIIVGVGDADFSSMDVLDADDTPLYSKRFKKYMASDIVQFVPFSEFKDDARLLAKETLEEVPRQFLSFMERNGIVPKQTYEKAKIKHQLSQKKSLRSDGAQQKEVDQHFAMLEEQFINKMTDMGYEYTDIKDFIEDRGLPEDDPAILIAGLSQPHAYHNKLLQKANNMG